MQEQDKPVTPLPVALYESRGIEFELYDGGKVSEPQIVKWEHLAPVTRKMSQ